MMTEERLDKFLSKSPRIDPSAYIAPQSVIIGDVSIGKKSSVWPMAVLRADINSIEIGDYSNVQDGCVIHLSDSYPVKIGDRCTIGHMALIHACTIGNECMIGMHSTILDGAEIGDYCIVGANALVTKGTKIPSGSLVLGSPAKVVRALSQEEQDDLKFWAEKYVKVSRAHKEKLT